MSEFHALLEEEERRYELPPGGFDRLVRRRDRQRRTKQVGALVFTLALLAVLVGGGSSVFRSADRRVPAGSSGTLTTPPGEPVRPPTLPATFDVFAAWGETDGVRWEIWTDDGFSDLAFTIADGSGSDRGYGRPYDGSDLDGVSLCAYGCPVPDHPVMYGIVSDQVARVELVLDDGTTYVGTIHPQPQGLTVDARIYTVPIDRRWGSLTGTLTAFGPDGAVLEQMSM